MEKNHGKIQINRGKIDKDSKIGESREDLKEKSKKSRKITKKLKIQNYALKYEKKTQMSPKSVKYDRNRRCSLTTFESYD